ncbi:MAG: tRNA lysidine(34) synthetase TilS [Rhodospirillales bacterium]|nr:tRNA lysidine(34) synthetase TilS [Rhodospirillales bacterium]
MTRPPAPEASERPLADAAFAARMAALGPFEARPWLAIAVSGGSDSMALCLLADAWARTRGGKITALTVDHGLRRESADEARLVQAWLGRRGIEHRILSWLGAKPATGIQARARAARYDLLTRWCADAGVLHLVLAHHRDDQAETYLFRRIRGSGPDGMAGMSALVELRSVRLLRPLLDVPKARLRATLAAAGQPWIEDPSNVDPAYGRTQVRGTLAALARAGVGVDDLARMAARFGRQRAALEAETARLLARAVSLNPAGFARVDAALLRAVSAPLALRALARVLMCVGGREHPPRRERLLRLHDAMREGSLTSARTLGGCRILPTGGGFRIAREADHRRSPPRDAPARADAVAQAPELPQFRATGDERVSSVPHMNYKRGTPSRAAAAPGDFVLSPRNSLSERGFVVADGGNCTI